MSEENPLTINSVLETCFIGRRKNIKIKFLIDMSTVFSFLNLKSCTHDSIGDGADFREKIQITETYKLVQCCDPDVFSRKTRSVQVPRLGFFLDPRIGLIVSRYSE